MVTALGVAVGLFGGRVALTRDNARRGAAQLGAGRDCFSPQALVLVITIRLWLLLASWREFPAAAYLSVPVFAGLTATRQLTPVWAMAVCAALLPSSGRSARDGCPQRTPAIEIACMIPRYPYIKHWAWFSNPLHNLTASASLKTVSHPSDGRIFTTLVQVGLSASAWLLAAIALYVYENHRGVPWTLGIITSSAVLVLGPSYGGESILRVFLYSLTGCSVLIGGLLRTRRAAAKMVARSLSVLRRRCY